VEGQRLAVVWREGEEEMRSESATSLQRIQTPMHRGVFDRQLFMNTHSPDWWRMKKFSSGMAVYGRTKGEYPVDVEEFDGRKGIHRRPRR
jgi:hypothetical protein